MSFRFVAELFVVIVIKSQLRKRPSVLREHNRNPITI